MFCPKCKSIISKKRINNQIIEFCNCPDKLESNYVAETTPRKTRKVQPKITNEGKIITIKERNKKKFTTIQESTFKPKREPSEYSKLELELRISNKARMPTFWKQNEIQQRLLKQTEENYNRYYRKIEDFFKNTELRFYISFLPNETLTEFFIDHWGLAFGPDFTIFYAGTKLNDLASWESKVLEKESDLILPYPLFSGYSRKLDFDKLSLRQLLDILRNDWIKFKESHQQITIQPLSVSELYSNFKKTFLN